ncbi:MAG TPA: hypothetical protein DCZ45_01075 [Parabacteroides goldsteinii]|jgi:hypothetical protein|nr:MAG TPA: hypothetical protein [Caudoviricetes sp.]HBA29148.1 hypothetical protein [Parabacteroides goldsteinii]
MNMKKQTWKMHFNNGVLCKWDGDIYDEERDNYVFEADLYIAGYSRGCSSAVMLLVPYEDREKNHFAQKIKYQVFMSDIEGIVKEMIKGRIKGSFTWVKKGGNYGLRLV